MFLPMIVTTPTIAVLSFSMPMQATYVVLVYTGVHVRNNSANIQSFWSNWKKAFCKEPPPWIETSGPGHPGYHQFQAQKTA